MAVNMESVGYLGGDIIEGFTTTAELSTESFEEMYESALVAWDEFRQFSMALDVVKVNPAGLRLLYGLPPERCDYSWLWPTECAHCLGHELPDDVPVQQS